MKKEIILTTVTSLILFSCGVASSERGAESNHKSSELRQEYTTNEEYYPKELDEASQKKSVINPGQNSSILGSLVALAFQDSSKSFIKTSQMKFQVNNVYASSVNLELIARKYGGYIHQSNLERDALSSKTYQVSKDSSMTQEKYKLYGDIVMRIPDENLYVALLEMGDEIEKLDYRWIDAEDITYEILRKKLAQNRQLRYNERMMRTSTKGNIEGDDAIAINDRILNSEANRDEQFIQESITQDKVDLSEVSINIYQAPKTDISYALIEPTVERYEPSFADRSTASFSKGWNGIKSFIIALISIWPLLIIGTISFFIGRRFLRGKLIKIQK